LLTARGFTCAEIEKILLLDERTLNRYKHLYTNEGIDGLTANNYQGSAFKLSEEQIDALKRELDSRIYRTAGEVCEYVRNT
jgi:transposase